MKNESLMRAWIVKEQAPRGTTDATGLSVIAPQRIHQMQLCHRHSLHSLSLYENVQTDQRMHGLTDE